MHKYCEQQNDGRWILDLFGLVNEVNPYLTLDVYKQKMYNKYYYGHKLLSKGPTRVILYDDDWFVEYNRMKSAIEAQDKIVLPFPSLDVKSLLLD